MSEWQATNEIRLLRRALYIDECAAEVRSEVLQQKWAKEVAKDWQTTFKTEWRDVPIVDES